jgi:hypothetical protein
MTGARTTKPIKMSDQNTIRIFVSSTFRDMHAEREVLVKRVFPQLRKLCESRGVAFHEVDLRWGISDEQLAEGQILPICLAEVERCRPFFIGLLGQRYGWVPDVQNVSKELLERYPWLAEARSRSVTELEMIHAVLLKPAICRHACFYFRDPAWLTQLSDLEQSQFQEKADPDEICRLGMKKAQHRAEERQGKLELLKQSIRELARQKSLSLIENYPDPNTLGDWVLRDLTAAIDQEFPISVPPSPLDRETALHEAFARHRIGQKISDFPADGNPGSGKVGCYIGRPDCFNQLDQFASSRVEKPLVIIGESGSGKSALLANWAVQYRQSKPDDLVILHFVGASADSTDWRAMLRRIMAELQHRFDIPQEIPEQPNQLRTAFANWLHLVASQATEKGIRIVIVIDGLNQLEDREGAPDLVWLPPVIPNSINLMLSTIPGRSLAELTGRQCPTLEVTELNIPEREQLIDHYLAQYTKRLNSAQRSRIAEAEQTANPLFLRALLEELRVFGVYERLDQRIDHYLEASSVDLLFERILARWEEDYDRDRPGLVRDAMTYIWAARRGLAEADLLELLGTNGQTLPQVYWSHLYLAAEHSLVTRSGLITFFHDYLRQAVQQRYLVSDESIRAVHSRLADYFQVSISNTTDFTNTPSAANRVDPLFELRQLEELPWQLTRAASWPRLYQLLGNLEFFRALWLHDKYQSKNYWFQMEQQSAYRMTEAYQSLTLTQMDDPKSIQTQEAVASLYHDMGYLTESGKIRRELVEYFRAKNHQAGLSASLGNLALILIDHAQFREALQLLREQDELCRSLNDLAGLQRCFGNQALIWKLKGKLARALKLRKAQKQIARERGDRDGIQRSLGSQALIITTLGKPRTGLKLLKIQERMCRELGNRDGLQVCFGNQAMILKDLGKIEAAWTLYQKQQTACEELGDLDGLQRCFGNQASILRIRMDLDGALNLLKRSEQICRQLDLPDDLQASLGNQAIIHTMRSHSKTAMDLLDEQESICRSIGNLDGLQHCLGNKALLLQQLGELDNALLLHSEEERLCREIPNQKGLADCLGNQGLIFLHKNQLKKAMRLFREQNRISCKLGYKHGIQASLGNQAVIFIRRGKADTAARLLEQQYDICKELGDQDSLQVNLGNQAMVAHDRGELEESMRLLLEQERICRVHSIKDGLQRCLGNQASIYRVQGELDRALELSREQLDLCYELNDRSELQTALGTRALILLDQGNFTQAQALLAEQEIICSDLTDTESLQICLGNQAAVLIQQQQYAAALPLLLRQQELCQQLEDTSGLHCCLGNLALVHQHNGDFAVALELRRQQELLSRSK